jgi:hypothetical protein
MRHVSFMLKRIDVRLHNEYTGLAALQGIKLPRREESVSHDTQQGLSSAEEKLVMKSLEEAKARRRRG